LIKRPGGVLHHWKEKVILFLIGEKGGHITLFEVDVRDNSYSSRLERRLSLPSSGKKIS